METAGRHCQGALATCSVPCMSGVSFPPRFAIAAWRAAMVGRRRSHGTLVPQRSNEESRLDEVQRLREPAILIAGKQSRPRHLKKRLARANGIGFRSLFLRSQRDCEPQIGRMDTDNGRLGRTGSDRRHISHAPRILYVPLLIASTMRMASTNTPHGLQAYSREVARTHESNDEHETIPHTG
jgi:hypothetical protein